MSYQFALFAATPIGTSLALESGGLVLTTLADALSQARSARSDIAVAGGVSYAEFFFYGDDTDLNVRVGIMKATADLDDYVGADADGIGYDPALGVLTVAGVNVETGLATTAERQVIGLQLDLTSAATARLLIYANRSLVVEYALGAVASWHFAVSLGSTLAGGIKCAVNAGQQAFDRTSGISEGWFEVPELLPALRFGTEDYLSATSDTPANTRYEGNIGAGGVLIRRALQFWPWGGSAARPITVGNMELLDADGAYDSLVTGDWRDQPLTLRTVASVDTPLASATLVGQFVLERVEVASDASKTLVLRDTLVELDVPLQTGVFYPYVDAVALQPYPIAIGACRSVPALLIDSTGENFYLSQDPVVALTEARDMGDLLAVTTDYALDAHRRQLVMVSPPVGKLTADLSTVGSLEPEVGDNLWDGVADPFAGTEGGAITGWTRGASSGDSPYFAAEFTDEYITTVEDGKPRHLPGVVFPDGDAGTVCWIKLGTMAAGGAYRYELIADVGDGGSSACLGISPTTNAADILFSARGARYFSGVVVNPTGSSQDVYLLCVRGGAGDGGLLTYAALWELSAAGPRPLPETLEGTLRALFAKRGYESWNIGDAYAIDTATAYAGVGYFTQGAGVTLRQAVDAVLPTYCACLWQSEATVRVARLVDPADTDSADYAFELVAGVDFTKDLRIQPDNAPALTRRAWVQPNWAPLQDADLVSDYVDLPAATRIALKSPGRQQVSSGTAVAPRYRHADAAAPRLMLFEYAEDGQAELARVLGLYSVNRHFYRVQLDGVLADDYPLSAIGSITATRYGLDAGKPVMVVGNDWNPVTGRAELLLWG